MSYEHYHEDIPQLVRGRLDPQRAAEILRAAENDQTLRHAIAQERSLESLLDLYDVPEPSAALEGSFWRRFHESRVMNDVSVGGRRTAWMLKLVGPLAAGVLIAVGIVTLYNRDGEKEQPQDTPEHTAQDPGNATLVVEDDDWDELAYFAGVSERPEPKRLDADALETMKQLDHPAFLILDDLAQPEDLGLVDNLEVLQALDRAEGK